ncbi:hypothetical protein [Actinoplanes solisilvae]|uniref:hypothetical protein n=1 Tax=Actinoplanes solisilvae TaxID=2486853 RepID=UPI0013E2C4F3|nr:hypothetical protein [Actinoplanes solisilvae]HET6484599.1 hypothetical protein [Actinoplanes sp.]
MLNSTTPDSTPEQIGSPERDKTVLQQSSARIRARLRAERAAPDEVSSTHSASIPAR